MSRVVIVTLDRISTRMAGPAIRAWEMARHLARTNDVRLLVREVSVEMSPDGFDVRTLGTAELDDALEWSDAVIFQGYAMYGFPELASVRKSLISDVYDPFHLESLELNRREGMPHRLASAASQLDVINEQLKVCDYFICASEKQRDFWLGQLTALGRVDPLAYDRDPTLRDLIDVVPFGIPTEPPVKTRAVLKGVREGIGVDDTVIVWGGGIYEWFDPLTVIRAVDGLKDRHPGLRLFFMGMRHPNPDVGFMDMGGKAVRLARELGLLDRHVFFNEGWVPYDQRGEYLLESDVGVSCHFEHVETTYSYRTRVLDYLWAGLPVVTTTGDSLGRMVEDKGLGLTVAAEDVPGWVEALDRMISDPDFARSCEDNVKALRPELTWEVALRPLVRFCENPIVRDEVMRRRVRRGFRRGLSRLPARVFYYWRHGGWIVVRTHGKHYLRRGVGRLLSALRGSR